MGKLIDCITTFKFTEQGIKNIKNFRDMLGEAREIMEQHGVRMVEGWATLGDVLDAAGAAMSEDGRTHYLFLGDLNTMGMNLSSSQPDISQVDEIAQLAQQIVENDYINGETIRMDGGIRMQPK